MDIILSDTVVDILIKDLDIALDEINKLFTESSSMIENGATVVGDKIKLVRDSLVSLRTPESR